MSEILKEETVVVQQGNNHVHALQTEVGSPATYSKTVKGDFTVVVARATRPIVLRHGKFQNRKTGERPVIQQGEHGTLKFDFGQTMEKPIEICTTIQVEADLEQGFRAVYD